MKKYEYRILNENGKQIKTLSGVKTKHPRFTSSINGGVGSLSVELSNPRDDVYNKKELQNGNILQVVLKKTGDIVYMGRITEIRTHARNNDTNVAIKAVGFVAELSTRIFEDGDGDTGLMAYSEDPSEMFEDVIDLNAGKITKGAIESSGIVASMSCNGVYCSDVIVKIMERLPNSWYWYVDAEGKAYLKEKKTQPKHIFTIGREITSIATTINTDNIVNDVLLIGGTPDGEEQIVVRRSNQQSQEKHGKKQKIITDGRVTDTMSIDYILGSNMSLEPDIDVIFDVLDDEYNEIGYDIEKLQIGDAIKIKDTVQIEEDVATWDNAIWDQSTWDQQGPNDIYSRVFIITRIDYAGTHATITTSNNVTSVGKDLATMKRNARLFENKNIPIRVTK